jgi:type I restriction enzyme M protein
MNNEEFGFARLTVERPLRRVWRVDEEILLSAPAALRIQLERLTGQTFTDSKMAEEAILSVGFDSKESKIALKAIAATDQKAIPTAGKKQTFEPDPELREIEHIPLPPNFLLINEEERSSVIEKLAEEHLIKNVYPYVSDAWIDHSKTKLGYEIPFTRQFYSYTPPRAVAEIRVEIESLGQQIQELMEGLK